MTHREITRTFVQTIGPRKLARYCNSLRIGRSRDPIPVGARFSSLTQTEPGGPPSLLYKGYRVCFAKVKRPEPGVCHPPSSSVEVKERIELHASTPSLAGYRVNLTFHINIQCGQDVGGMCNYHRA